MSPAILEPEIESVESTPIVESEPSELIQEDIDALEVALSPAALKWSNLDWVVIPFFAAVHIGAVAAPFYFTWAGLATCLVLHWVTCSIGICLCYHRYLSHKSFKLKAPAEFTALACAAIAGEGPPLMWTAMHRRHHQKSDQPGDPHSPLDGKWWSHLLWMFPALEEKYFAILFKRYTPELYNRPMIMFFERTFAFWLWGTGAAVFAAGWLMGGLPVAMSMLLWGVCVRMVFAYHSTWFVNSATHLWGYRNYKTRDHSRNLWWVAVVSYGEGWHNNHHAHPSVAPAGHRWWEIDMTWWAIRFLRAIGQAYDVRDHIPARGSNAEANA